MELRPGLRRIGNDIVAAHLVVTDDGITLVDAGLPGHWRELQRELAAIGRTPADIRGVVLTHGDSDHIGFAERLRSEHGVPVFVHAADAARARGEESTKPAWGGARIGPVLQFLAYSARKGGLRTTYLREVSEVVASGPGAPKGRPTPKRRTASTNASEPPLPTLTDTRPVSESVDGSAVDSEATA